MPSLFCEKIQGLDLDQTFEMSNTFMEWEAHSLSGSKHNICALNHPVNLSSKSRIDIPDISLA